MKRALPMFFTKTAELNTEILALKKENELLKGELEALKLITNL